jgi:hypothetical protein
MYMCVSVPLALGAAAMSVDERLAATRERVREPVQQMGMAVLNQPRYAAKSHLGRPACAQCLLTVVSIILQR